MRRSHGLPVARSSGPVTPRSSSVCSSTAADAAQALEHDLVLVDQRLELVQPRREVLAEGPHALLEAERDVLHHAADLEVARVHALARGHLEEVEDAVAVAPAVPEDRDRAEVQRAGREPDQVRGDPVELEVQDAQVLRARRDLEADQRLDGAAVGHRVEVVGEVVHPLDDGDDLPVRLVLGGLLDAGVDVADDRLDVAHDLALEREQQPQHPVRGRVVRAHVERQQLLVALVLDVRELDRLLHLAVVERRGGLRRADLGGAHCVYLGSRGSLCVKNTGSPPTGKSRRCGWPS